MQQDIKDLIGILKDLDYSLYYLRKRLKENDGKLPQDPVYAISGGERDEHGNPTKKEWDALHMYIDMVEKEKQKAKEEYLKNISQHKEIYKKYEEVEKENN